MTRHQISCSNSSMTSVDACGVDAQPTLDGVEAVSDADNQWFGDMMILQVLADSDNVNEQEREVLTRWMAASDRPSVLATAAPSPDAIRDRMLREGVGDAAMDAAEAHGAFGSAGVTGAPAPRPDYRAECWPESPHHKPARGVDSPDGRKHG